jgi:hypothetical protein
MTVTSIEDERVATTSPDFEVVTALTVKSIGPVRPVEGIVTRRANNIACPRNKLALRPDGAICKKHLFDAVAQISRGGLVEFDLVAICADRQ